MGVKWETIPAIIRTILERSIRSNINEFTMHQLILLLKGTDGMGFKWVEDIEMKQTIFEIFSTHFKLHVHARETISPLLSLLGRAGVKWMELPEDQKNILLITLEKECQKPLVVGQMASIVYG
jgi:hypothetical protein